MYFNLEMENLMVQCNPKTFKIMRRSLRDSIVGFSLLGGILIFTFFSFWLRGVRLSSKNWHLFAEFNNASGLSKKSPVTYRGILVGSIEDILIY